MNQLAFLFPGQGVQKVGMAIDICGEYPEAREAFAIAERVLGRDLYALCMNGPQESLDLTINTQVCILAAEVAVLRVLQKNGIRPDAMIGFSLGEVAALVGAEVITFEQAISFVAIRAKAMQDALPPGEGGMAVVIGQPNEYVEALCAGISGVVPANYNCPLQVTVSGTAAGIEALLSRAEADGIIASRLPLSVASHCWLMEPAARVLEQALSAIPLRAPSVPVYMNATGEKTVSPEEIRKNLIVQLTRPVLLEQSIRQAVADGITSFAEVGPGRVLTGFAKKIHGAAKLFRTGNVQELQQTMMTWQAKQ